MQKYQVLVSRTQSKLVTIIANDSFQARSTVLKNSIGSDFDNCFVEYHADEAVEINDLQVDVDMFVPYNSMASEVGEIDELARDEQCS